jgi:hypothetical protein
MHPKGLKLPCILCGKIFVAMRQHQTYCGKTCRWRAQHARARSQASRPPDVRVEFVRCISTEQARRRGGHELLLVELDYLRLKAAVLEAEQQLMDWRIRLAKRQTLLSRLTAPEVDLIKQVIYRGERLTIPDNATHYGWRVTDGQMGVCMFAVRPGKKG